MAKPDEAQHLAKAFEESRYGRPDLQRIDDADAAKSYSGLRGALFGAILRRKPPTAKTAAAKSKK